MTASQASLFDSPGLPRLCGYGTPRVGERRPCSLPATHRAVWSKPATYLDGTPHPHAGESGGISCCRAHADYYAAAWVPHLPNDPGSAWIEILAAAPSDATPSDTRRTTR